MSQQNGSQQRQASSDFVAEVNSTFEPLIIARVCQPVLERLPESVAPNAISLFNHFVSWLVVAMAISSPHLGPIGQPVALVLAGLGTFATMVMDCLDGMQARRTNRCSKLGELMDHWLDAIHVVLGGVGIVMALQLAPWAVAAVVSTTAMVYNAQLVLYHHRGAYVHPPTSGVDAQVGVSVGFVGAALFFSIFSRQERWVELLLAVIAVVGTLVQTRLAAFYYRRLGRLVVHHLKFLALCGGWAALYLAGAIDALAFVLAITFTSFRVTGSYVLYSIVKQPYGGFDWGLALLMLLIGVLGLFGGGAGALTIPWLVEPLSVAGYRVAPRAALDILPYLAFVYIIGRNLHELRVHFAELRPSPR